MSSVTAGRLLRLPDRLQPAQQLRVSRRGGRPLRSLRPCLHLLLQQQQGTSEHGYLSLFPATLQVPRQGQALALQRTRYRCVFWPVPATCNAASAANVDVQKQKQDMCTWVADVWADSDDRAAGCPVDMRTIGSNSVV